MLPALTQAITRAKIGTEQLARRARALIMRDSTALNRSLGTALVFSLGLASLASADELPDPGPEAPQASAGGPQAPPPAEMIGTPSAPTLPEPATPPPTELIGTPGPATLPEQTPQAVGVQLDLEALAKPEPNAALSDTERRQKKSATSSIATLGLGLLALVLLIAFFVSRRR